MTTHLTYDVKTNEEESTMILWEYCFKSTIRDITKYSVFILLKLSYCFGDKELGFHIQQ